MVGSIQGSRGGKYFYSEKLGSTILWQCRLEKLSGDCGTISNLYNKICFAFQYCNYL